MVAEVSLKGYSLEPDKLAFWHASDWLDNYIGEP